MERISADSGSQFISTEFIEECQTRGVQVKVTREMLQTIAHSLMVHAKVLEVYINLAIMYMTNHIFPVLPNKFLIEKDDKPTTPFKVSIGTKPSVSHLRVSFFHVLYGKLLQTLTKMS